MADDAARINRVIEAGRKEFPDFDTRSSFVAGIASNLDEFRQAVLEMPNAHQVVAALSDDPDAATTILRQRGVKMAAALATFASKPRQAEAKATGHAATPPPARDIHDPNIPMRDWSAAMTDRERARLDAAKAPPKNANLYDPKISSDDFDKGFDRLWADRQARKRAR